MKQYYGNYLGVVITGGEKDPEGRGRVQVFIPHIMPTLYEGWNKEGEDIQFDIVGEGLPTGLDSEIVKKLQKMLPWAECAAPIVGASPSVKNGSEAYRNTGNAAAGSPSRAAAITGTGDFSNVSYQLGSRKGEVKPELEALLSKAATDNYGPGASVIIYSGAGTSTTGTQRHTDGSAADVIFKDGQGNIKRGAELAKVTEYWLKNNLGSVGFGMSPGIGGSQSGLHLDLIGGAYGRPHRDKEWYHWNYGSQPKEITDAISRGLEGRGSGLDFNPSTFSFRSPVNMRQDDWKPQTVDRSQLIANNFGGNSNMENFTINEIRKQGLDKIPVNEATAKKYFNGNKNPSAEQWTNVFSRLATRESGWNAAKEREEKTFTSNDPTTGKKPVSTGLYQLSQGSVRGYQKFVDDPALKGKIATATTESLKDPYFNTQTAVAIMKQRLIKQGGAIESNNTYWSPLRPNHPNYAGEYVASGANPDTPSQIASSAGIAVQNPTPYEMQSGPSTNNQARGMFGYASEGTTVWVFFREGDPHYPVYFAASYGQREWENLYQYSSPGIGAGKGPGGAIPGTEVCDMRLYGGGQRSVQVSSESGLEPDFVHQIYSTNGSNLTFTKDHTEFNSIYDHVNRVMGDHHDITEANKETRVRGDMNTYAEQDVYVTVGNWSDEAIEASREIQQYINEAMEIKSSYGNGGGGTSGAGSPSGAQTSATKDDNTIVLEAARKATQAEIDAVSKTGAGIQNPSGRFAIISPTERDPKTGQQKIIGYTNNPPPGYRG